MFEDAKNVVFTVDNANICCREEPLLTVEEASELAEFLDMELINIIRKDEGIENINWVVTMATAYKKLKEYSGYVGLYDPQQKCTMGDRWKTKEDE